MNPFQTFQRKNLIMGSVVALILLALLGLMSWTGGCSPSLSCWNGKSLWGGSCDDEEVPNATECLPAGETRSNIKHLVVIIQENHSFDSYFGNYCKATPFSNPTCTEGPDCCEAGPQNVGGNSPVVLTDAQNLAYDPNHSMACELEEINNGKMDRFISGANCSNPQNFAYADAKTMQIYWDYASHSALADRYFQPSPGASSQNNMYFAQAKFVFGDNSLVPNSVGKDCFHKDARVAYKELSLGDLFKSCDVSWSFYAEGYQEVLDHSGECLHYPKHYDPSDNPFQYYKRFQDNPSVQKDFAQFASDIAGNALPSVSFIKALGIRSEHPGISTISDGAQFVAGVVSTIQTSPYRDKTLILVVPDESGGFYDHIPPPPASSVDQKPYGPRVPLLAMGPFVKANTISHVVMEHSSIVRFIEWNYLGGTPGQLKARDAQVNGIGSLLDPTKTGVEVP